MARVLKAILLVLLCVVSPGVALAQDTGQATKTSKSEDIRRLLEVTGTVHMGEQIIDQMLDIQRRALPEVPEALWEEIRKAFDTNEMVEIITTLWDKHFTQQDIRGLIVFYESPLGTKLRQVQPQILQESMAAGQAWGMRAFKKLKDKLREKGYSVTA